MSANERGFSLLEVLIAMAISSILLLSSARFLPALQREILRNTRQLALEDEIWQRPTPWRSIFNGRDIAEETVSERDL